MEPASFFQTPIEMRSPFWTMIPGTYYLCNIAKLYVFSLRCYKRSVSLFDSPLKKEDIAKTAFFRLLVEVNETAETTFTAAALILNIQNTLIRHVELAEACENLTNATRNAFPYNEKRLWNNPHKRNDFSHYYRPVLEKLRKLSTLIWDIVKKFFILCAAYLTTYDLCATGPKTDRFRLNAICEVCVDPSKVLPKFNENQIKLNKFLENSEYTNWIEKVLKKHHIESVDALKQKILKIVCIPEKIEKMSNKLSEIAKTISELIIMNPSKALRIENREFYHSRYKKLGQYIGLVEEDKSDDLKPYPPYIGSTLPSKKEYLSWIKKKVVVSKTPEKQQVTVLNDTGLMDSPLIQQGINQINNLMNTVYQKALNYAEQLIYGESSNLMVEDKKDKKPITKLFN
jgi:hypothetical protein